MTVARDKFVCRMMALCLLSIASSAMAEDVESPSDSRFQLGTCELPVDPLVNRDDLWWHACAKARYGWETVFVGGAPDENGRVRYADGYLGLHVNRYVSLHGRGLVRHYMPDTELSESLAYEEPDLAVIQFGNPAFHKFRFLTGRMRLPFGIDYAPIMESYRLTEDRSFWDSPKHGAQLTYDNLRDVTLDTAIGTDEFSEHARDLPKDEVRRAISARAATDFPALDGSRLLFSGYWENDGPRKFGFGFVTISRRSDLTQFEWIRLMRAPTLRLAESDQMFRVGYKSAFRNRARWVIQYDDIWRKRRSFIFGHDLELHRHLLMRIGLTFQKQLVDPIDHRYLYLAGLEARL